jgi:3-dehydroquinate synthetase
VPIAEVVKATRQDKKKRDNVLRVVLPERIGSVVVRELPYDEFERLFI